MKVVNYRVLATILICSIFISCAQKLPTKQELQQLLTQRAEQGDVQAQFELGKFYYFLEEDPARHEKAYPWFMKASEKGNVYAMHYLGRMYLYGYFVQKDEVKAKEYFSKSIATIQNDSLTKNPEAWYCLAWSHHYGIEVEKNNTEAVKWFEKAAKKGHVIAQYDLGLCYIKGEGVELSSVKAIEWIRKASESDNAIAQFCLASMLSEVLFSGNPSGKIPNHKELLYWLKRASDLGLVYATFSLSQFSEDENEKESLLKQAANKKYLPAMFYLGSFYLMKQQFNQFGKTGIDLICESADGGYKYARHELFTNELLLSRGMITKGEMFKWIKNAAEHGDVVAQYKLSQHYYEGIFVKKNEEDAFFWLLLARSSGRMVEGVGDDMFYSLKNKYTLTQIIAFQEKVDSWIPKKDTFFYGSAPWHLIQLKDLVIL